VVGLVLNTEKPLNHIELIWAFVKGKLRTFNQEGGTKYVISEAMKYEDKFWERDRFIDPGVGSNRS